MNRTRLIFKRIMLFVAFFMSLLVVLAFALPAVSVKIGDTTSSLYFLSAVEASVGGISARVYDPLICLIVAVAALVSPYLILYSKSKAVHSFGIALLLASAAWSFVAFFESMDLFGSVEGLSYIGVVFIFVEAIIAILYLLLSLAFDIIGERIIGNFRPSASEDEKTVEEKLTDAKNLFDKNLITETEYDEIKKTILDKVR